MTETIGPIHSDEEHRAALAEIERLWDAEPGTPDGDRLEVLMTLVDAYERAKWPSGSLDPIDAIKARMENSGRTRKDLEQIVGSSARASEILNRKRRLTLPMIWRLVQEWKMPADVLVRPYEIVGSTSEEPPADRRPAPRPLLSNNLCKWPIGHPGDPDFSFCTERALEGKPYCAEHCGVAFGKVKPPKAGAA